MIRKFKLWRRKEKRIEPEIIRELGELGVFAPPDGSELDPTLCCWREMTGGGALTVVSVRDSPTCIVIANSAPDAQKGFAGCASGEAVGSFGLTEPQAGSDASDGAVKKGGAAVCVNGWKTNSSATRASGHLLVSHGGDSRRHFLFRCR